jgi:hypothetical protein
VPTRGLGVSLGLEWKISRVRKESRRAKVRGSVNRSFQTGRVEPDSSDFVESLRLGSTQKTAYGLRSPVFQFTFLRCFAEIIVRSRSRGTGGGGREVAIVGDANVRCELDMVRGKRKGKLRRTFTRGKTLSWPLYLYQEVSSDPASLFLLLQTTLS